MVTDYDFTKPRVALETQFVQSRNVPKSDYEVFDYPGKYQLLAQGDHYNRVRLQSLTQRHLLEDPVPFVRRTQHRPHGGAAGHKIFIARHEVTQPAMFQHLNM